MGANNSKLNRNTNSKSNQYNRNKSEEYVTFQYFDRSKFMNNHLTDSDAIKKKSRSTFKD